MNGSSHMHRPSANQRSANQRSAIVIVVDRLGAGYLGPGGNTWIETPAFNRLASQSLVWEYMLATTSTLAGLYDSLGTGRHPMSPIATPSQNLWEQLQQAGVHTALLTDEPLLAQLPIINSFAERIEQSSEDVPAAAESLEQTQLCQAFVAALDWLAQRRDPFCLLLHSRGMAGAWDAPREYRERFADEEDPPVPDFVAPPHRSLGQDIDPDEIWGMTQAYAGQVALLDVCLEMLLESLQIHPLLNETLLIVTSPRGFPLGEHGHVGERGDLLYEELLHVPLLIRQPDPRYAMQRCQTLVEPADLYATLADWFQLSTTLAMVQGTSLLSPFSSPSKIRRECVVSLLDQSRSIRTPAWFLRRTSDQTPELYAKPDDRWEVNEVADRCGEITEELMGRLAEYERMASEDRLSEFPALPEHLLLRSD